MARSTKPSPPLFHAIVTDDTALTMAIDAFVRADPAYKRRTRKILRRQRELRALLDSEQWDEFLGVEEATNERLADAMITLVRWAFAEGRRTPTR